MNRRGFLLAAAGGVVAGASVELVRVDSARKQSFAAAPLLVDWKRNSRLLRLTGSIERAGKLIPFLFGVWIPEVLIVNGATNFVRQSALDLIDGHRAVLLDGDVVRDLTLSW